MFSVEISDEIVWFQSGLPDALTYVFNKKTRKLIATDYMKGEREILFTQVYLIVY